MVNRADVLRHLTGNHPRRVVAARPELPRAVEPGVRAVVAGAGIAGVTAALLLAERGVEVTLVERADRLGGRLAAWPQTLADGSTHVVGHGFHGFFRQYYNWRAVLRRIDPGLSFLRPLDRYPVTSRRWPDEDLTRLPAMPPFNLLALLARSPNLRLHQLRNVDGRSALPLLSYSQEETYRRFDTMSAADFLASLGMPERARAMLFDVFAHSFFNRASAMSAAEMIMYFHFYFLGNPEGLGLDAPDQDYETAIWTPLAAQLQALGVDIRTSAAVDHIEPGWTVTLTGGARLRADHVVLATDPGAARTIVASSPALTRQAPRLAEQMATIRTTAPYVVTRLWTDRDTSPRRAVFTGVSGEATLDSITLCHRLERAAGQWARCRGGAVIELHAYAAPDDLDAASASDRMRAELMALWPETAAMSIVDSDERMGQDAPAFAPGSDASRPAVHTDADGLHLAGDWVRVPLPTALMERAATSAMLAVNEILDRHGIGPEPVHSVPPRGLLARVGVRHGPSATPGSEPRAGGTRLGS